MNRVGMMAIAIAVFAMYLMLAAPAEAIKVYVNPSIQTSNYSPDGVYQEGSNMQDVAAKLMTKLIARGFEARNSGWLDLASACADSNSWGSDCFVALHTDATGTTWSSAHGSRGFFHQSSSGWHDDRNVDLAAKITSRMAARLAPFGRGYNLGAQADYPWCGWNMYVIAPWNTYAIPAVLIEGLYHTNYDDVYSALLLGQGRDAYARGVFEGICDYYGWDYWGYPYWPWKSSGPVTIVVATGRMEIFARGSNNSIWHRAQSSPNGGWGNWSDLGGLTVSSDPCVVINAGGGIEVFVRGADGNLYHRWQSAPAGSWSSWESLGGPIVGKPGVGRVNGTGYLEVYARFSDGSIRHRWCVPTVGWTDWSSLGGTLAGDPVVGINSDGRQEVFCRGTNNHLYHTWQTSPDGPWSSWSDLGGTISGNPEIGEISDGRLEVYCRWTDGSVRHIWQVTGGWSSWESLGGTTTFDLAVADNTSYAQDVFCTNSDGTISHRWQSGGWQPWENLGGTSVAAPIVGHNADGRKQLFIFGPDGRMYSKWELSGGGWSSWTQFSDVIFPVANTPPTAPTLTATTTGTSSVALSWTASTVSDGSGIANYDIYRNGSSLATVSGTTTSYTDTNLSEGTQYTYKVRAKSGNQVWGSFSADSSATTWTTPTVPTNLAVEVNGSRSAYLTWSASTDSAGIADYEVVRNGSSVGTVGGSTTHFQDDGLAANTTYTYQVRARCNEGVWSSYSATASGTTWSQVASDSFANLSQWQNGPCADGTSRGVSLDTGVGNPASPSARSDPGSGANNGSYGYIGFSRPFAAASVECLFYDSSTSSTSENGVAMRKYNGASTSQVYFLGVDSFNSSTVYSCEAYGTSGGWVKHGTGGNRAVGWRRLRVKIDGTNAKYYDGANLLDTIAQPSEKTDGVDRFYIGMNYNVQTSAWYDDFVVSAPAPGTPSINGPTAVTTNSVTWNWTPGTPDCEQGFDVKDANGALKATAGRNATSLVETNLSPNTLYTRQIVAWNGTVNSLPSANASTTTLSVAPTTSNISSVPMTGVATTGVFTFTSLTPFGAGGVQYYRYAWDQSATHTWTDNETQWTNGDLVIDTDTPASNYYIHIKGFNSDGVANGTLDTGPYVYVKPSTPTGLTAAATGTTTTHLSWNAVSDANGISNYEIYRNGSPLTTVSGTTTNYDDSNLSAYTQYSYQVRAKNGANHWSNLCAAVNVTTWSIPTVPGNPSATATGGDTITFSWTAASSADGSGISAYEVYRNGASLTTVSGTTLSFEDSGLSQGTQYTYKVRAKSGNNVWGGFSSDASATTWHVPTGPTNVVATSSDYNVSRVTWNASTDPTGIANYEIWRNGSPLAQVGGGVTVFDDSGLSQGTTYTYQVRAKNNEGHWSQLSSSASVKTWSVLLFDPFANLNNWTASKVADGTTRGVSLDASNGSNLAGGSGAPSARSDVGSGGSNGSYAFNGVSGTTFAVGYIECSMYDSGTNNNSRNGIAFRKSTNDDISTPRLVFFLGCDGAFSTTAYTCGVYGASGGWTKHANGGTRSVGWHRFRVGIDGTNVKFYVDGTLKDTIAEPAEKTDGLNRWYIGNNYNVNYVAYYDDFFACMPTPPTPTPGTASDITSTSIRWNFTEGPSDYEQGFYLRDTAGVLKGSAGRNATCITETGLTPNTTYYRTISAYNGTLESPVSIVVSATTAP